MRLRELIDVLTKYEAVCGPDTETTASTAALCLQTSLSFENEYHYRTKQVRKPQFWVSFNTEKLYDMSEARDSGIDGLQLGKSDAR